MSPTAELDTGANAHSRYENLLPWYVNGSLEPSEKARVRRHVDHCGECRRALDDWRELAGTFEQESQSWSPPAGHFEAMMAGLSAVKASPRPLDAASARWRGWLAGWWATPVHARWALAVQSVVVVALGVLLFSRSPAPTAPDYTTLTAAPEAPFAGAPAVRVRPGVQVVFDEEFALGELNALLEEIGAQVVEGPSRLGVYKLSFAAAGRESVPSERDLQGEALARLRGHRGVSLAEPLKLREAAGESR